jgi:putative thiamine transport system permease protein
VAMGSGGDRRLAAIYALIQLTLPALTYAVALVLPRVKKGTP